MSPYPSALGSRAYGRVYGFETGVKSELKAGKAKPHNN